MEVAGVYSLEDAEDLIVRRGDEEEVEVKVHKCILRDVPQLREILREQIQERHWGVANLSRLRQFVPVDEAVGAAAQLLIDLAILPNNGIVAAAIARAQELLQVSGRLRGARMRWAQGLGTRLETVGHVMETGNKRPAALRKMLLSACRRCAEISEREVTTIPVRIGG